MLVIRKTCTRFTPKRPHPSTVVRAASHVRVNVGLLGAHGARYAKELHEFVDESEDEVPRVSGDVRLGDEEAPEDDHQERVKHVAYVAQPAKNNEI